MLPSYNLHSSDSKSGVQCALYRRMQARDNGLRARKMHLPRQQMHFSVRLRFSAFRRLKNKMKLPSTLKERRHYIIIKKTSENEIKNILMDYLGIINYAKAGPKIINLGDKLAISIERDFVNLAKTALIMSKIPVMRVTGTIKKARSL